MIRRGGSTSCHRPITGFQLTSCLVFSSLCPASLIPGHRWRVAKTRSRRNGVSPAIGSPHRTAEKGREHTCRPVDCGSSCGRRICLRGPGGEILRCSKTKALEKASRGASYVRCLSVVLCRSASMRHLTPSASHRSLLEPKG